MATATFPDVEQHPKCAPARERYYGLKNDETAIVERIARANARDAAYAGLDAKALALLDGDGGTTEVEEESTLEELYDERRTVARAVELQKRRYEDARAVASREVRLGALETHQLLGRNIRKALLALRESLRAEAIFRASLDRSGASFGPPFVAVAFPRAGNLSDDYQVILDWLKFTADYLGESK